MKELHIATTGRSFTLKERLLSRILKILPIKHGKHRLLHLTFPFSRKSDPSIVSFMFEGSPVTIDIGDLVGWHFAMLGSFDPEVVEILLRAATHSDVYWDIGANKGACCYPIAARLSTAKIVAIEPQLKLRHHNQINLTSVCPNRFEYYAVGIGEKEEMLSLTIPTDNLGKATLRPNTIEEGAGKETVQIVTAKTIHDQSKFGWPTLVKIDVEGYELEVISSLKPALRTGFCKIIVFENHLHEIENFLAIKEIAKEHRYEIYGITKNIFATNLVRTEELLSSVTDYAMVLKKFAYANRQLGF
jgi:FkbM family methyltransferase